jgi:DME family drug/metabolite transporter
MGLGAVMGAVALVGTSLAWLTEPRGIAIVAWLAVATIVVACLLSMTGLSRTSAAAATTLNLSEPATATLLGMIVLGEQLTLARTLGIIAIVSGVLLLGFGAKIRHRRPLAAASEIESALAQ